MLLHNQGSNYDLHFTNEETKAQRGKGLTACLGQSRARPGLPDSGPSLSTYIIPPLGEADVGGFRQKCPAKWVSIIWALCLGFDPIRLLSGLMLSVSGASLLTLTSSHGFYGHLPLEVVVCPLPSLTHKILPGQAGRAAQAPSTHKRTAPPFQGVLSVCTGTSSFRASVLCRLRVCPSLTTGWTP